MSKKLDSEKESKLKKAQEFAKSKGGKCLSTSYLGTHKKHEWECENSHPFTSTYTNVVNKRIWHCKKCKEETRSS